MKAGTRADFYVHKRSRAQHCMASKNFQLVNGVTEQEVSPDLQQQNREGIPRKWGTVQWGKSRTGLCQRNRQEEFSRKDLGSGFLH